MSILTCSANMLPHLSEEDRTKAMYQGLLHVSRECAGKPPRFLVKPLPTGETRPEVLKEWFRNFIDVRDEEGAERCLSTAIELGLPQKTIADMVFAAATDHLYLDTYAEMLEHGRECEGLMSMWSDESGKPNLSLLDMQRFSDQVHVQSYHLRSDCDLVLRTQSIFQVKEGG